MWRLYREEMKRILRSRSTILFGCLSLMSDILMKRMGRKSQ